MVEAAALVHRRLGLAAVRVLLTELVPALAVRTVGDTLHDRAVAAYLAGLRRGVSLVDQVSFEVMRDEVIDTLRDSGTPVSVRQTRSEVARRAPGLGLREVAEHIDRLGYGPVEPTEADAIDVWAQVGRVRAQLAVRLGWRDRWRSAVSLQSAREGRPVDLLAPSVVHSTRTSHGVGGASGSNRHRTQVTRSVIAAMQDAGVRRLIVHSSLGVGDSMELMPAEAVQLRGTHNLVNVLAASAIGWAAGLPLESILAGVEGFMGVPHRLEQVRELVLDFRADMLPGVDVAFLQQLSHLRRERKRLLHRARQCLRIFRQLRFAGCPGGIARTTVTNFLRCRIHPGAGAGGQASYCLLYTSDAADDLLCVDLGGRRILKKKTIPYYHPHL